MKDRADHLLTTLPSMTALLAHPEVRQWSEVVTGALVKISLGAALQQFRDAILQGRLTTPVDVEDVVGLAEEELTRRSMPSLRRVINATGIVLHTGLGRAPLSAEAIEAIAETASGYCNLEFDLSTGQRGRRLSHVAERLAELTGAEAALVVNNNAAATYLILHVLAEGREVLVSRGQLVEIGGSFRLPQIMSAGGAILREVGTTNRTRAADYEAAATERTALVLRVHPSNYRVVGFSEEATPAELAALARARGLRYVDDLGSGAIVDLAAHGLPPEPCVRDSIRAGADLVCFSGDKLFGGPQCGMIVGKRALVDRLAAHPLMRALRVDKLTLAALEATLRHYVDDAEALRSVPALAMLNAPLAELADRANDLARRLQEAAPSERFLVGSDTTYAGGGAMPVVEFETVVVRWVPSFATASGAAARLRDAEVSIVARIRDDAVCFDMRTVRDADLEDLVAGVEGVVYDAAGDEGDVDADEDDDPPDARVRLPVL
ncbi:MAG: L-seryl-tRNA(Sec) selenium transferase [Phycisphaerae bacterium]|nr:L-seryl-tRNA(Sec) selenium transferase [Phycisphaerae bacterium]